MADIFEEREVGVTDGAREEDCWWEWMVVEKERREDE